ncbi:nodulation protein NfeD [Methylocaldum sp.]|uniref:NfeD family protein n=1 Tax=Methylocaldum sp. TaxID=1969727 RepID=UPI002D4D2A17|nr:nodulation protein NfeD [Methylocaldum sp.]HYE35447.1 nodulation protein NfeD [Methylocaldum sp.]
MLRNIVAIFMLWLLVGIAGGAEQPSERPPTVSKMVAQLTIDGPIGPATSDYVGRALEQAQARNAVLAIIRMDTPGGLDTAMRDIIRMILASPFPIVSYVAPSGARAASAGTYILYASHIAAMAPATNLGAATPVAIGAPGGNEGKPKPRDKDDPSAPRDSDDAMSKKMINDAVAYLRGLAHLRGRNAEWVEKAVREGASLAAEEALAMHVVDIVAPDVFVLLTKLQGRRVDVLGRAVTLDLTGAVVEAIDPDWRSRLLAVITNPNVAYILMMIGVYGLILEFYNPGSIVPGTVGVIALLLAMYAFQVLPVNYAGLALIIVGIGLMVAEAFAPSFGVLGLGGIAAFIIGSVILIDTDKMPGVGLSWSVIAAFALTSLMFFGFAIGLILRSRHKAVVTGREELIGAVGTALENFTEIGRIHVRSEIWTARTEVPVHKGQRVSVKGLDGLILSVAPSEDRKELEP